MANLANAMSESGIDVVQIDPKRVRPSVVGALLASLALILARIRIRGNNDWIALPASLSTFGLAKDWVFMRVARLTGTRISYHFHAGGISEFVAESNIVRRILFFRCVRTADLLVVLSQALKEDLLSAVNIDNQNIAVLPNTIASDFEQKLLAVPPLLEIENRGVVRVLWLSNLIESKGLFLVLSALDALDGAVEWRLDICGDQRDLSSAAKARFAEWLAKHPKHCTYHGTVRGAEKLHRLTHSDIFVLPSIIPSRRLTS